MVHPSLRKSKTLSTQWIVDPMADAAKEEEEISKNFLSVDFIGHREMLVVWVVDEHWKELVVQSAAIVES